MFNKSAQVLFWNPGNGSAIILTVFARHILFELLPPFLSDISLMLLKIETMSN